MSISSAAVTCTSSRSRSFWFGRSPSTASKDARAIGTRSGWATQEPSKPSAGLAVLVRLDLLERHLVDLGVAAGRDERRHAADRVRAALVAGAHQQFGVGAHERRGHRHRVAVRQHEPLAAVAEVLHDREQVVPAARVEPGGVVAQLVEDLVHLVRGGDRLDQHGGADGALRDAECSPGRRRTRRSTAALRGATRSWAGRSTGPCRGRSGAARCGRSTARSRPGRRGPARRPRSGAARRGASRAGASPRSPARPRP